jgi:hypothetical protein
MGIIGIKNENLSPGSGIYFKKQFVNVTQLNSNLENQNYHINNTEKTVLRSDTIKYQQDVPLSPSDNSMQMNSDNIDKRSNRK